MKENREEWKGIISAEDHDAFKIKMKEFRENNVSQQQYHVHICSREKVLHALVWGLPMGVMLSLCQSYSETACHLVD